MAGDLTAEIPEDIGPPLTQANLSTKSCVDCGETAEHHHDLEMAQRCHTGAGFSAVYRDGVLYLFCRACEDFVLHLAIAPGATPGAH